jgi:hypothetical protein
MLLTEGLCNHVRASTIYNWQTPSLSLSSLHPSLSNYQLPKPTPK